MNFSKCDACGKECIVEVHHKFSKSQWAAKLYGNLLHNPKNISCLCYDCHHNKPLEKWDEETFCKNLKIEPRSKVGKQRAKK